jgi:uncharacterized membrane protein YedE/YeeE
MKHRAHPLPILLSALASGAFFGYGLAWSTMVRPEAIVDFLLLRNFGLLLVMGGAAGTFLVAYQLLPRLLKRPLFGLGWSTRPTVFDRRLLIGSALFGVGWGLSGVCPGPALAGLGVGNWPLALVVVGILLGAWLEGRFFER